MSAAPPLGAPRRLPAVVALLGLLPLLLGAPLPAAALQEPRAPAAQEPPVVLGIRVEGARRYREAEIIAALGQGVGQPLDQVAVNEGTRNLWRSLKIHAEVSIREVPGGVELLIRAEEMPVDLEPRFIGNADVSVDTLREWAGISDQTELFLYQAPRVQSRILDGYRRAGYYWAEVHRRQRGEDPEQSEALPDVIFEIFEGPKVRVRRVEVRGNHSMPDSGFGFWRDGLKHLAKIKLSGPGIFNWRGDHFVQEVLDADLLALRQVYRDRGWLDAVVELEELHFNRSRSRVTVRIVVDEGQPFRVSRLAIRAEELQRDPQDPRQLRRVPDELLFPEEELLALCELVPGERYEAEGLRSDERALRDHYGAHGYLDHDSLGDEVRWRFLEPELTFDEENKTLAVTYVLTQGRQLTVREIRISGTDHTLDKVVRRELSVFPGELADLTEINRSLRRVTGTGFFSDSFNRIEHREPTYRFLPVEGEESLVDLEFRVEEGRVVNANLAGGVASDEGLFGLITLSMQNFDISDLPSSPWSLFSEVYAKEAFHGAGETLDVEIAPGTQVSRFRVHYFRPDILGTHLDPVGLDLELAGRRWVFRTHREDRLDRRIRLSRSFGHDLVLSVGYSNAEIHVRDLEEFVPPLLQEQEAMGRSTLAGGLFDVRMRSLDHFMDPREGYQLRWRNAVNGGLFGGDFDYVRSELGWDWYRPVLENANGTRHVLHVELDAGVSQPYEGTDNVPYSERFQLGGRSLRGFDFRGVGPVDPVSGYTLGGETFLSGSLEWQAPLLSVLQPGTYRRIETLRGILFLDFGLLHPDPFQLDPDELRASLGFGIGLAYPLPIALNFGFPILEKDGDRKEVISFSFSFR